MFDLMNLKPYYIFSEDEITSFNNEIEDLKEKNRYFLKKLDTDNKRFEEERKKLLGDISALKQEAAIKYSEFENFIEPLGLSTAAKNALLRAFVFDSPLNPFSTDTCRLELTRVKTYGDIKRIVLKHGISGAGKVRIAEIVQKCDEMIKGETNG